MMSRTGRWSAQQPRWQLIDERPRREPLNETFASFDYAVLERRMLELAQTNKP